MSENDRHDDVDRQDRDDDELTSSLLGAYVLDAVDADERAEVERLLSTDPEARAEVARLDTAADALAEAAAEGSSAPPGLWGSISAELASRRAVDGEASGSGPGVLGSRATPADATSPATDDVVVPFTRPAGRRRGTWVLSAAAAVVVVFVVGAVLVTGRSGDDEVDPVAAMEQLALEVAELPGSRTGALTDPDRTMSVDVVVDAEGHAFVMSAVLPTLDEGQTYQLWAVDGGTPVSLGLLGHDPTMSVVGVDAHVHQLAITVEPAGGVAGPTTTPMASGTLSQA